MRNRLVLLILFFVVLLSGCFGEKNSDPVANFTYLSDEPGMGEVVIFDASSSSDKEDGQNLLARWDFDGDGVWDIDYSAGKRIIDSVSYVYFEPGIKQVVLEVKDTQQKTNMVKKTLTIVTELVAVEGFVVDSRGGVGLSGASIKLFNSEDEYISDTLEDGSFQIEAKSGVYNLIITKDGYSTSKIQDLYVGLGLNPELDIPLREEFYSEWSSNPPQIIVENLPQSSPISPLSGEIEIDIKGKGELGINSIEVTFGHQNYAPDFYYLSKDFCKVTFDTTILPDGWNYLRICMYDANFNFAQTFIPVYVDNATTSVKLTEPEIVMLFAMTFGQSLKLMEHDGFSTLQKHIPRGIELDMVKLATSGEEERTIFTEIVWTEVENARGYRLYRSLSEDSGYSLIATTSQSSYTDLSACLTPGQKVYYKVSAYSENIEGPESNPEYTIPLDVFNVTLESPVQDGVVFSGQPVFQWNYNQKIGDSQSYDLLVQGVTDEVSSLNKTLDSMTTYVYDGIPLVNGKIYEWDITSASAFAEYNFKSFALSVSGASGGSLNGAFRFVTHFE